MGTMAGWYTRRKNKSEYEAALCEKAERYGEQRAVEGIVRWIMQEHDRWCDPHDKANFRGIADAIERSEWKEGVVKPSMTAFAFAAHCSWAEWETGQWEADCGLIWELNGPCTTPTGHGMNFCPGCGRRLVEHPYVEPAVEDGEEGA